jgi:hypothetical protein
VYTFRPIALVAANLFHAVVAAEIKRAQPNLGLGWTDLELAFEPHPSNSFHNATRKACVTLDSFGRIISLDASLPNLSGHILPLVLQQLLLTLVELEARSAQGLIVDYACKRIALLRRSV